jgi:hypothetical protein
MGVVVPVIVAILLVGADVAAGATVESGRVSEAVLSGERVVYVRGESDGEELVEARGTQHRVLARSEPSRVAGEPLEVLRLEASNEAALVERLAITLGKLSTVHRRDLSGVVNAGGLFTVQSSPDDGTCIIDPGDAGMLFALHRERAVVADDGCGKGVRIVQMREGKRPRTLARIPHGAYGARRGTPQLELAGRYLAWRKLLRGGKRQQVTVYDWRDRRAVYRWKAPRSAGGTGLVQIDLDVGGRAAISACSGRQTRCVYGWLSPYRDGLQVFGREPADVSWDRAGRMVVRLSAREPDVVEVHDLLLGLKRRAELRAGAALLDATGTCLLLGRANSQAESEPPPHTLLTRPFPGLTADACPA